MELIANDIYYNKEYYEIKKFAEKYDCEKELSSLLERYKQETNGFVCPNCLGKGTVKERYNAYPTNLPDSGWGEDWRYCDISCPICHGSGHNETRLIPNMVQDGWKRE